MKFCMVLLAPKISLGMAFMRRINDTSSYDITLTDALLFPYRYHREKKYMKTEENNGALEKTVRNIRSRSSRHSNPIFNIVPLAIANKTAQSL
jgi:hypothetical protein